MARTARRVDQNDGLRTTDRRERTERSGPKGTGRKERGNRRPGAHGAPDCLIAVFGPSFSVRRSRSAPLGPFFLSSRSSNHALAPCYLLLHFPDRSHFLFSFCLLIFHCCTT